MMNEDLSLLALQLLEILLLYKVIHCHMNYKVRRY